jgi:hypothetical protein
MIPQAPIACGRQLMKMVARTVLLALAAASAAQAQTPAKPAGAAVRICADQAHGETLGAPITKQYSGIATKLGGELVSLDAPTSAATLQGCRVLVLRVPTQEITQDEREAILNFIRNGGSMLLAFDEERRAPLETTRVNDLIAPFGLTLTADTEYLHNNGAIAKKGVINAADRELPFSGGRAVEGGTPFAWQLDKDGKPGQVFGASTTVGKTAKVVVLSDAMATLFLGTPEGVRLTGVPRDPSKTTYWGKDAAIFMEELLTWLIK